MKTYDELETASHSDTEITLGMRSILGIFFALALICGIFFGFGYSLGRGHSATQAVAPQSAAPRAAGTPASDVKTIIEPSSASAVAKPAAGAPIGPPTLAASTTPQPAQPAQAAPDSPATAKAIPAAYSLPAPAAANGTTTPIMVQIAAVSRREDADVLVSALHRLGYSVSVRSEPADQLLHVQVGPFATRDQAKAMRAKLLNDGYNAILK